MAVGGADPAVCHPLDEVLEGDVDVGGAVDPPAGFFQGGVERLGLDLRPREAIEDGAGDRIRGFESIEEDAHDRVVRNELAATHVAVRLAPEGRAVRNGLTQQVTGSQDRDTEPTRECRGLRPLARPRSAEQDDDGHDRAELRSLPRGTLDCDATKLTTDLTAVT